jgi:hypothetical protein
VNEQVIKQKTKSNYEDLMKMIDKKIKLNFYIRECETEPFADNEQLTGIRRAGDHAYPSELLESKNPLVLKYSREKPFDRQLRNELLLLITKMLKK